MAQEKHIRCKVKEILSKGFSLIELMVALAIFCVIIALTFTNVSFLEQSVAHNEIDKLHSIAHYLARRAQMTNQEQVLQFDRLGRSYSFNGRKEMLPSGIEFGTLPGIKGPPSSATQAITNPITFKGEKITFHPQGIMQSGTVYLMHKKNQSMYGLSCAVAQVSFLRKYRYDKRWILME